MSKIPFNVPLSISKFAGVHALPIKALLSKTRHNALPTNLTLTLQVSSLGSRISAFDPNSIVIKNYNKLPLVFLDKIITFNEQLKILLAQK